MTHEESLKALKEGKRVQFHYEGRTKEVTLETTLDDLRWAFLAKLHLTVSDVINGHYSIIE
ncbi:hypothetical protein ACRC6Q_16560 [Planococcus sp. SE5232]|uniref:hypothetical protein n=1 Tax=unclassified Planococcus (in: firmicutes) TaxID=2662419 RepID=UPI003D6BC35E